MCALPILEGKQQEVVYLDDKGHIIVLGTAGSGKTTMAIHRAIWLQQRRTNPGERTLLITFSRVLISYLKTLQPELPEGLDIENYHRIARGFLDSRGKMAYGIILGPQGRKPLVEQALEDVRDWDASPTLKRDADFFIEEFTWLARFGIVTLDQYTKARRIGRKGTNVDEAGRQTVWQVYKRYLELRHEAGYWYDWDDLANAVETQLINDKSDWKYKHVIVDEGQDFSPTMLRSLAAGIPDDGSLTFFGDIAQQVYGIRLSWRDAGLSVKKTWQFQENYRNTLPIATLALALAKTPSFEGEPDIVAPRAPVAMGPLPSLVHCENENQEMLFVSQEALKISGTNVRQIAILLQSRDQVESFLRYICPRRKTTKVQELHSTRGNWHSGPGIFVGTYQSAKGLEFDTVFMPYCNNISWPITERVTIVGLEEASAESARLLYVGITRAKKDLILSYSGEFTSLIPRDDSLYDFIEV